MAMVSGQAVLQSGQGNLYTYLDWKSSLGREGIMICIPSCKRPAVVIEDHQPKLPSRVREMIGIAFTSWCIFVIIIKNIYL